MTASARARTSSGRSRRLLPQQRKTSRHQPAHPLVERALVERRERLRRERRVVRRGGQRHVQLAGAAAQQLCRLQVAAHQVRAPAPATSCADQLQRLAFRVGARQLPPGCCGQHPLEVRSPARPACSSRRRPRWARTPQDAQRHRLLRPCAGTPGSRRRWACSRPARARSGSGRPPGPGSCPASGLRTSFMMNRSPYDDRSVALLGRA